MKVLFVRVLLEKNEHMSTPKWIYPWEIPVFAAVHRNAGVQELERRVFDQKVVPRADTEFQRLSDKYKAPEGTDVTYVASIYGHGSVGVRKLHEAMKEAAAETAKVAAVQDLNPPTPARTADPEFDSPFGELPSDEELGIETQADLRDFVSGSDDSEVTVVAA